MNSLASPEEKLIIPEWFFKTAIVIEPERIEFEFETKSYQQPKNSSLGNTCNTGFEPFPKLTHFP